ncbi:uncharacterized protein LOC135104968 isoform X3 [Scylla paramamosain]|uniref:uncharacterized protein LOC135104968 isoform X3 n=1 Tax=Scylla paramamosain TaxID=85552 RepID=UPI003083803D
MGTTTVPNRNGTAIFTNLSVSKPGEGYNLTFTITYPSYAPALTTTLEETFSLTKMSAAMVLQQPSIVQAGQPTTITVHFVDKDSGLVLNGLAFKARHLWANCWQRLLRDTLRLSRGLVVYPSHLVIKEYPMVKSLHTDLF